MKNVVFMGTPDFAVGTLEALLDSKYTVQAVFTQPDKPKGRKGILTPSPVKECAAAHGIPVYQPKRIRDPENLVFLKDLAPDVIVVVAFGQILSKEILELPPYGCINVHASLLPKYRGAAPIQWAIIDGESNTGITTMRMDEGVDTGDIIFQEATPILPQETGGSLFEKLSGMGAKLLIRTLDALDEGSVVPVKQPELSPTPYAAMLGKKDGEIDWAKSAGSIDCLIRGLTPWPGSYTWLKGKQLKICRAAAEGNAAGGNAVGGNAVGGNAVGGTAAGGNAVGGNASEADCETETCRDDLSAPVPGTVIRADKTGILVQTGEGCLRILELQLEGRKRMEADAFLRGCPIGAGTVLGGDGS